MKYAIGPLVAVILATRVVMVVRRRKRRDSDSSARGADRPARRPAAIGSLEMLGDGVGLVALREIRERVRGRVFRVGTLIILLAVAAAVVIPTIGSKKHQNEKVGIVGGLDSSLRILVVAAGKTAGATVQLVSEPSLARAEGDLRAGNIGLAIVGGQRLVVNQPLSSSDTSTDALMARSVSASLGLANGLTSAGLSPDKAVQVAHSPPLPVESLQPAEHNSTAKTTSVYGLILTYVLLTQYGTWLLMGVIEEKSSRVIEVLLSTMRPSKLLAGKVIGIGTVAFLQSALIVAVALGLGAAVGSTLLHGSSPLDVLDILLWLVLGYLLLLGLRRRGVIGGPPVSGAEPRLPSTAAGLVRIYRVVDFTGVLTGFDPDEGSGLPPSDSAFRDADIGGSRTSDLVGGRDLVLDHDRRHRARVARCVVRLLPRDSADGRPGPPSPGVLRDIGTWRAAGCRTVRRGLVARYGVRQ